MNRGDHGMREGGGSWFPGRDEVGLAPFPVYVAAALVLIALVVLVALLPLLLMAIVDFVRAAFLDKPPLVNWPALPDAFLKIFESRDFIFTLILGTPLPMGAGLRADEPGEGRVKPTG
jgi:hypothetical protein